MKLIDCKQGTTAWQSARVGIPTASEFDNLVTPEFKLRTGETPKTYLLAKVAEKVMGFPRDTFASVAMNNGTILEGEAVPWFGFAHGIKVDRVGFCTTDDGRVGCSPDGLIGDVGGIEIKCPEPHTHLAHLLGGVVPKQYLAQVHGSMLVTGRAWWYFLSYNRHFPALLIKVQRDEEIISKLQAALSAFLGDFDAALAKLNALIAQPGR